MESSTSDDDSEGEWEDVEPLSDAPAEEAGEETGRDVSLEITLQNDGSTVGKGKRKSKQNFLQKAIADFDRELRYSLHKVHLLCLLAHGLRLSSQCDHTLLQCLLLSLTPQVLLPQGREQGSQDNYTRLLKWFSSNLTMLSEAVQSSCPEGPRPSPVQLLVALLRTIGLRARLVLVLNPLPFKTTPASTSRRALGGEKGLAVESSDIGGGEGIMGALGCREEDRKEGKRIRKKLAPFVGRVSSSVQKCSSQKGRKRKASESLSASSAKKTMKADLRGGGGGGGGGGTDQSTTGSTSSPYFKRSRECLAKGASDSRQSDSEDETSEQASGEEWDGDSSDFEVKPKKKKGRLSKYKNVRKGSRRGRGRSSVVKEGPQTSDSAAVVASDNQTESDTVQGVKEKGTSLYSASTSWTEVYLRDQKQWCPLHLPTGSAGLPQLCMKHCNIKLNYVVAIETNSNGFSGSTFRDVTPRYAFDWCTRVRRQRLSEQWWAEVCRGYSPLMSECEEEDEALRGVLCSRPLPTVVSDYKSHPLYAMKRHLLKFEAIYPEESEILGYCKGEAVFARECVHTLHTRETWLKEGRVVKSGEKPHKTVKARPKKGQSVLERQNATVEVFGQWQTEVYVPPPVVEGKVPRNEYGNVELFQPSMLPPGACHIKVPGIQRVARKLGIDHAPAMMGWDFHSGYCHPVLEGIVVAEEWEELLMEAWQQEQQLQIEKQLKRREQRVLDRWRKLTRGVLIKERIRRRYLI